jgi:hypothetical protein
MTPHRLAAVLAPAVLVFTLAAAAASAVATRYNLQATEGCLRAAGYAAARDTNPSLKGSGGNLKVFFPSRGAAVRPTHAHAAFNVYVVFGRDAAEAFAIRHHAVDLTMQSFAAEGVTYTRHYVLNGVQLTANVFVYSSEGPLTTTERSRVDRCLR